MGEKKFFSVKMRASAAGRHISGAERILREESVVAFAPALLERALHHAKGKPDFMNVKCEAIAPNEIVRLPALSVTTREVPSLREGLALMRDLLQAAGVARAEEIVRMLTELRDMRGAVLLNVDTMERLESDPQRGVRVTYMDDAQSAQKPLPETKNHYAEAIVLATKVANAPHLIGELCISDDPDYVTGYIASREMGYVRITKLKEKGSPAGGRIFLFRGDRPQVEETIAFLQQTPVLVEGICPVSTSKPKDRWMRLADRLDEMKAAHLYRSERVMQSEPRSLVRCEGRELLMLASNDYLDLAAEPVVKKAAAEAAMRFGAGTGGARLTTGTLPLHQELEQALAIFKGEESAILYNTGFMANVGVISALVGKGGVVFSDELNHASIIDGCRLSGARIVVYRHNDMKDLERKILEHSTQQGLVVSDAVFSMDGDLLDLPGFLEVTSRYGLFSVIDEAHATGVVGKTGRGLVEHFGGGHPDVVVGTLSKALGSSGGFVCGRQVLIDFLRNVSRPYIFSTAFSPADVGGALGALRFLESHPERVERLRSNISFFSGCLRDKGVAVKTSQSAIVPILIGDEARALAVSEQLRRSGILVPAIRFPTVAHGAARLRVSLMATHTEKELCSAAEAISQALNASLS